MNKSKNKRKSQKPKRKLNFFSRFSPSLLYLARAAERYVAKTTALPNFGYNQLPTTATLSFSPSCMYAESDLTSSTAILKYPIQINSLSLQGLRQNFNSAESTQSFNSYYFNGGKVCQIQPKQRILQDLFPMQDVHQGCVSIMQSLAVCPPEECVCVCVSKEGYALKK